LPRNFLLTAAAACLLPLLLLLAAFDLAFRIAKLLSAKKINLQPAKRSICVNDKLCVATLQAGSRQSHIQVKFKFNSISKHKKIFNFNRRILEFFRLLHCQKERKKIGKKGNKMCTCAAEECSLL